MTAVQAEAHAREAVRQIFAAMPPVSVPPSTPERKADFKPITRKHLTLVVSR